MKTIVNSLIFLIALFLVFVGSVHAQTCSGTTTITHRTCQSYPTGCILNSYTNTYSCSWSTVSNVTMCIGVAPTYDSCWGGPVPGSYWCSAQENWSAVGCIVCTPNCSCASWTCQGSTCSNGCGGTCAGTVAPSASWSAWSPATCSPLCGQTQTRTCNSTCGGTCSGSSTNTCSNADDGAPAAMTVVSPNGTLASPTIITTNTATLVWVQNSSTLTDGYQIELYNSGGTRIWNPTINGRATTSTTTGVLGVGLYYWRIWAYNTT